MSALSLAVDEETGDSIMLIETYDISFADSKVKVYLNVAPGSLLGVAVNPLIKDFSFEVSFQTMPLEFDLSGFEIETVTCSGEDDEWSFELPPVLYPDI